MLKVEYINGTDYANIYGVYDKSGKVVGSVEVKIAGRWCGEKTAYAWTNRYTRKQIMAAYKAARA